MAHPRLAIVTGASSTAEGGLSPIAAHGHVSAQPDGRRV